MSLYSNMQICGNDSRIEIERRNGVVWVGVRDGSQKITMEAQHVKALWLALSAFEDAEWAADHPGETAPHAADPMVTRIMAEQEGV
jgi:hypothetical protein